MNILILSPLFPPDVGAPASYVKELALQLQAHNPTLLLYGYLPEAAPGTLITVDKRTNVILRLVSYTKQLFLVQKKCDLMIVNNAPSTELPALLVSFFYPKKTVLCISDPLAIKKAQAGFYGIIHSLLKKRCAGVITLPEATVYEAPEILPFTVTNQEQLETRTTWWKNHIATLLAI